MKPLSPSLTREKKPVSNTVKKAFKLHPDQKEIVEAALKDAKSISGTKFDTVALEYVCQGYMGTSPSGYQNAKAALTAEFKESGDAFLFLERVGNWLEEILGKEVTVSVSE